MQDTCRIQGVLQLASTGDITVLNHGVSNGVANGVLNHGFLYAK